MARPIDADGFLDRNAEFANREFIHPKYQVTLRELVDSEPTLSPDEVRGVGEWISNHDGSWNCSECGLRVLIYAKGNFCPSCGARMKGAESEHTMDEFMYGQEMGNPVDGSL